MRVLSWLGGILAAIIVASIIGANNQITANARDIAVCKAEKVTFKELLLEVRQDVKEIKERIK